ncbi:MAG: glycosyltransferase family 4 protein [Stellaceae bacterium]
MRAASHIKVLSERFDVTLAIVGDHGGEAEAHRRLAPEVREVCASVIIVSRTSFLHRRLARLHRRLTPGAGFLVHNLCEALWPTPAIFAPYFPAVAELGRRLRGERFAVVHCFRLNSGLLRSLRRGGVVFARSVLDFDGYESRAEFRATAAFRRLVGKQLSVVTWLRAVKWRVLEALLIPRFDDGIVSSEDDCQRLRRRFPGTRWHVVPNAVAAPAEIDTAGHDGFTFLFVGQLGYLPNWDAVLFFCTRVLPVLRQAGPESLKVLIVGRAGGNLDRLKGIDEVQIVVDPPDIAPYYAQADAVIVPLRGGSGTRIKIIEAFSYGLPVVSTTIGAEGLEVTPQADILIGDDPQAFAEQCRRIMVDNGLRRRIAAAGHELWRTRYSLSTLVEALEAVYATQRAVSEPRWRKDPGSAVSGIRRAAER